MALFNYSNFEIEKHYDERTYSDLFKLGKGIDVTKNIECCEEVRKAAHSQMIDRN
jgi:hypothetical protein